MKRKRIRSFPAICIRVIALAVGLWLLCMVLFTLALANNFYTQFMTFGNLYTDYYHPANYHNGNVDADLPGYEESQIMFYLGAKNVDDFPVDFFRSDNALDPLPRESFDYDRAVVILDEGGNIEFRAGDYLFFNYMTPEQWQEQTVDDMEHAGFAYVELNKDDRNKYSYLQEKYGMADDESWLPGRLWMFDHMALRFQGYFENNRFYPVVMEVSVFDYSNTSPLTVREQTLPYWEKQGRLSWQTLFDDRDAATPALTTIYVPQPDMYLHDEGGSVDSELGSYDSLQALLTDRVAQGNYWGIDESFTAPIAISSEMFGTRRVITAVTCNPAWEAVKAMRYVYLGTFVFLAVCLFFLLRSVHRNLTFPLSCVNDGFQWGATKLPYKNITRWQDARDLEGYFEQTTQELAHAKSENQRLNTALNFAEEAEKKRRQMISNITHELKTPLAVIHSYAEGLQAGIAEDKREKYLSVILEETEKMDAMVLEMLDLSRLDAGKVHLRMEQFSLLKLVQAVHDRLSLAADAKQLTIRYVKADDFPITADEGRIDQVVTNFLTNAIKYTPAGGNIFIHVCRYGDHAFFSMENDCPPLSEEALVHIWDSFYQADASHRSQGSGLGLAIARRIVELHRGSCTASSTPTGIRFRIQLPLK